MERGARRSSGLFVVGLAVNLALTPGLLAAPCKGANVAKQMFDRWAEGARQLGCGGWEDCLRVTGNALRLMETARTSFEWASVGPRPLVFGETVEGHIVSASERTFVSPGPLHGNTVRLQMARRVFKGEARVTACAVGRDGRMEKLDEFVLGGENERLTRELRPVHGRVLVLHIKGTTKLKQIRYAYGARIEDIPTENVTRGGVDGPKDREEASDATNRAGPGPEEGAEEGGEGDSDEVRTVVMERPPVLDRTVVAVPAEGTEATEPDCLPYDPVTLRVETSGGAYALVAGEGRVLKTLASREDAVRALEVARRHTQMCFIGRDNRRADRARYIQSWFDGESDLSAGREDCIDYDERSLEVEDRGGIGWLVTDGRSQLKTLATRADAEALAAVMGDYSEMCFIGRDNRRADRDRYILSYLR